MPVHWEISRERCWTQGSLIPISELPVRPVAPTPTSSQRVPSLSFSLIHSFSLFIIHAVNLIRGPVCYILSQGADRETIKVSNRRSRALKDKCVDRQCENITMWCCGNRAGTVCGCRVNVHLLGKKCIRNGWTCVDLSLILGVGSSPGEGNSNPLEYSCLGNSMDKEPGGSQKSQSWFSD